MYHMNNCNIILHTNIGSSVEVDQKTLSEASIAGLISCDCKEILNMQFG